MSFNNHINEFELICVIVNFGLGSKVLKISKENKISGGTIFLGKGTTNSRILELFGLSDMRKEIVLMLCEKITAKKAFEELNKEFNFKKPNHGIAFSIPVTNILGCRNLQCKSSKEMRGVENFMHNAIFVVVEKGNAESVIDAANKAGSKGGTIINGRGSGIHETSKLFSMEIEPEKEIVLILCDIKLTKRITSSIRDELKIDEPGNGIIFVQDVSSAYGLF